MRTSAGVRGDAEMLESLALAARTERRMVHLAPQTVLQILNELRLNERRLAYIASHGDAWSQAVARGEHDDAITGEVPRG